MKRKIISKVFLSSTNNWKKFKFKNIVIFYKGFIFGFNEIEIKKEIIKNFIKRRNWNFLKKNYGNFSIVIKFTDSFLLISDTARSFPLYYYVKNNKILISDFSKNIKKNFKNLELNNEIKKLSLMSGYTISNYTIYKDIHTICAGQYIEIKKKITKKYYIDFFPKKIRTKNYSYYKTNYLKVLNRIFYDLKQKVKNKKIFLALSAGDDSRLVACMLKKYNFKVICFSYGLDNNWEASFAKKLSKKLGFKHYNILIESKKVRKFFLSKEFKKYFDDYNNFDSVPSIHEIYVLKLLKNLNRQKVPIIMNGQPADGINGSYISKKFFSKKNYINDVFSEIIKKHYSLWPQKLDLDSIKLIKKYVMDEYKVYDKNKIKHPYQLMLFHSYQNRICKYLMKNYQVYENFNFNWFSPYMDFRFVNFWFSIPHKFHLNRNLSKKILSEINLFDLWRQNVKKNNNLSFKINTLRNFSKLFFLFNIKKWKIFDRKNFLYLNDNQLKTHIVSKLRWKNTKNFRSPISFLAAKWLNINPKDIQ